MPAITNESVPTLVRTAQIVGITSAAFWSGAVGWISYALIPTIKQSPPPLQLKQWKYQFDLGKASGLSMALTSAVSFTYLITQRAILSDRSFYLNTVALALVPGIVPFTVLFIGPVNNKLFAKVDALESKRPGEAAAAEQGIEALVTKWSNLNAVRSVMCCAGAVAGLLAIVW